MCRTRKCTEGSNPSPSATTLIINILLDPKKRANLVKGLVKMYELQEHKSFDNVLLKKILLLDQ